MARPPVSRSPLSRTPRPSPAPMPDAATQNLFEEIDQEVKAKQLTDFMKRYGGAIMGLLLVVVLATAGYNMYTNMQVKSREADSGKLIALLDKPGEDVKPDDLEARVAEYDAVAAKASGPGQRMLARFAAAGLQLHNGKAEDGIARLKTVSDDTALRPIYRDYATLMSVRARMDKGEADALQQELKPLLVPENPWYLTALETSAMLYAKGGKYQEAVNQLNGVVQTPDAPVSVRERAMQLTRLYSANLK